LRERPRLSIPCDVGDDAIFFEPTVKEREPSLIAAGLSQIRKKLGTPKVIIWPPPRKTRFKKKASHGIAGDTESGLRVFIL